jgi:hypothetical protein
MCAIGIIAGRLERIDVRAGRDANGQALRPPLRCVLDQSPCGAPHSLVAERRCGSSSK